MGTRGPRTRTSRAAAAGLLLLLAVRAAAGPVELAERGRKDFLRYCASCHGASADGTGPAAHALVTRPADLRRLSRRYGTPLDRDRLAARIDGRDLVAAHGDREMPVWGERFDLPPDEVARERTISEHLAAVVAYLQSIQLDH